MPHSVSHVVSVQVQMLVNVNAIYWRCSINIMQTLKQMKFS